MNRLALRSALIGVLLLATSAAGAQEPAADLRGLAAYRDGRYEEAIEILKEDLETHPLATSAYTLGLALEKIGRWRDAIDAQRRAIAIVPRGADVDVALQRQARSDAKRRLDALERRIPKLTIVLEGAAPDAVMLRLDDVELSLAALGRGLTVDPGRHRLTGRCRTGEGAQTKIVVLAPEANETIRFALDCGIERASTAHAQTASAAGANRTPSSPSWGALEWSGIGVAGAGVIGLGIGGYLLGSALAKKSDANHDCVGDECGPEGVLLRARAVEQGRQATAFAIGGGALAVAGAALFTIGRLNARGREHAAISFGIDVEHPAWRATYTRSF